jgi:hypothetical protein
MWLSFGLWVTFCTTEVADDGHGWERRLHGTFPNLSPHFWGTDLLEWKDLENELKFLLDVWMLSMKLRMKDCSSMFMVTFLLLLLRLRKLRTRISIFKY